MRTLIFDTSVVAYQLGNSLNQLFNHSQDKVIPALYYQMIWLESCQWWDVPIDRVVWALDVKGKGGYWRHTYLDHLGINYKGQRSKQESVTTCLEAIPRLLTKLGFNTLGVKGFEADDIAALFVTQRKAGETIHLLTIDTDWCGLIGPGVHWTSLNTYHKPVHRWDLESLNSWSMKRLKTTLDYPSQIWEVKANKGDRSDNLPPGSPIEVIDLLHPPNPYCLWEYPQVLSVVGKMIPDSDEQRATKKERGIEACQKLVESGIVPMLYPKLGLP